MTIVVFESLYQRGIEHIMLTGTHAEGTIASEKFALRYTMDCDAQWKFEHAEVVCGTRRVEIVSGWTVNGETRDDLRDCVDIDIAATPFTNTLPIRRLQIPIGEERAIAVVYIAVPELEVRVMQQRYRRVADRVYAYSGGGDYNITVDGDGLVVDYPPFFRRL